MNIFDNISYAKGSVVCRMLAGFTADKFLLCLKTYMDRFKFKNATSKDLLAVCDEISGKRHGMLPSEFLMPWLTQSGFPILTVHCEFTEDGNVVYHL